MKEERKEAESGEENSHDGDELRLDLSSSRRRGQSSLLGSWRRVSFRQNCKRKAKKKKSQLVFRSEWAS